MAILKDFYQDKMRVRFFDTRSSMGDVAGTEVAIKIKELLSCKETINVMFAAAPSQNETLATLIKDPDIDWTRVNAFHMDEYIGLDDSHPAGFRNFLKKAIFELKPFKSVNYLNGNAPDAQKEAQRYGQLLKDNPLDICILGVGENGHIAFNEPSVADFNDPVKVKVVELEPRCRQQQVNDGCFKTIDEVPTHALSVTIPALCEAKWMFCSVPAKTKAEAIMHMLRDPISTNCPATILRKQEHALLYTDKDAASLMLC